MKGSELLAALPPTHGREREAMVLNAVAAGYHLPVAWCPVRSERGGDACTFYVSSDSLRLGEPGDWTRMMASATLAQEVADALGCHLPTDKVCDLVHDQASVRLSPHTSPINVSLDGLRAHHAAIERERAGREGLTSTVGKDWIVDDAMRTHPLGRGGAVNYGWHGGPYVGRAGHKVWQTRGFRHDRHHADYSQLVPRMVRPDVIANGEVATYAAVLADPALAHLLSYSGALSLPHGPRYADVPAREVADTDPAPGMVPGMKQRMPDRITHVEPDAVLRAFTRAWTALFGAAPKRASLLVLLSQWALETGTGKSMHCYNIGNIKGRPDGSDGHSWTFFRCSEVIDGREVWFDPDHPACCFRAYETLDEGALDYVGLLHRRFAKSWPAVVAGDPAQFSRALKAQRYYTAGEERYTATLVALFRQFDRQIPDDGEAPATPHLDPSGYDLYTRAGVQRALNYLDPAGPQLLEDGIDGPRTRAAVKEFQSRNGLASDGIVGKATRAKLAELIEAQRAKP